MKFEHLVQINDPKLPGVDPLTRQQVWQGLVARAWRPTHFVLGLEDAQITETHQIGNVTTLHRVLNFGPFQIEDRIELHAEDRTETRVPANQFCGDSALTISIVEPAEGELWLRFQYSVSDNPGAGQEHTALSQDEEEVRRQAYKAADIDTVKVIRELAMAMPAPTYATRKDH